MAVSSTDFLHIVPQKSPHFRKEPRAGGKSADKEDVLTRALNTGADMPDTVTYGILFISLIHCPLFDGRYHSITRLLERFDDCFSVLACQRPTRHQDDTKLTYLLLGDLDVSRTDCSCHVGFPL